MLCRTFSILIISTAKPTVWSWKLADATKNYNRQPKGQLLPSHIYFLIRPRINLISINCDTQNDCQLLGFATTLLNGANGLKLIYTISVSDSTLCHPILYNPYFSSIFFSISIMPSRKQIMDEVWKIRKKWKSGKSEMK